ncbi:MAG: hypothetical protein OIF32_06565 [Campylobacterales bacterium]|nr:hypothetical protein [Campylobacterales bacterium]
MRLFLSLILFSLSLFSQELIKRYQLSLTGFPQNRIGEITRTDGNGDILKIKRDTIDHIRKGDNIHGGDIITQSSGTTLIRFDTGARILMRENSKLIVNKNGVGTLYGNIEFYSGKKPINIDTDFAKARGRNNILHVNPKNFEGDETLFAKKNNTRVSTPKDVREFDIYYENSGKNINAKDFLLKEGELASFNKEKVKISTPNKRKRKVERKGKRHYIGLTGNFSALQKDITRQTSSKEEVKLVGRSGFSYGFFNGRVDPIFLLSFTTDPEMDELKLEYLIPNEKQFQNFWFESTPYLKYSAGIGNTYSTDLMPTHVSLGIGFGGYKKFGLKYFFADINYKRREWKFDRTRIDEVWKEHELSLDLYYIFRFYL